MNKHRFYHIWKHFRQIKPIFFLALAILSTFTALLALRANNEHMIKLRDAVYAADKNSGDVQGTLQQLQSYVTAHMNTDLSAGPTGVYPPIQLKYTYDRLVRAQGSAAADANTQLYSAAQAYCEQQNSADFSGRNRVPCIEQYVQQHNTQQVKQISDALYKFSFTSPRWSPDLAGWSIFVAILSAALFVTSFVINRWFRKHA